MNVKTIAASLVLSLASASLASAQVSEKKSLTISGAPYGDCRCGSEAKRRNTTGVIAVVDDGGNLMAVERLDGTFSAGANISIGKARTAALFKKPTKVFEDIIKNGRTAMVALPTPSSRLFKAAFPSRLVHRSLGQRTAQQDS